MTARQLDSLCRLWQVAVDRGDRAAALIISARIARAYAVA